MPADKNKSAIGQFLPTFFTNLTGTNERWKDFAIQSIMHLSQEGPNACCASRALFRCSGESADERVKEGNRAEIRKLGGIKLLVDFLSSEKEMHRVRFLDVVAPASVLSYFFFFPTPAKEAASAALAACASEGATPDSPNRTGHLCFLTPIADGTKQQLAEHLKQIASYLEGNMSVRVKANLLVALKSIALNGRPFLYFSLGRMNSHSHAHAQIERIAPSRRWV
jgi:hypothetical protein